MTLTAVSVRAQLRAREQARLAGVFGQEVKTIESLMRIAHLAPEHDIRKEKAAIRERMAAIEAQVAAHRERGDRPGPLRAWAAGTWPCRSTTMRARAPGAGVERRLPRAGGGLRPGPGAGRLLPAGAGGRAPDRAIAAKREEKMKQAEREYRDPALAYLQQSRGLAVDSPEYVEALLAFYEKRYPDALKKAQAAYARLPWLHEARGLEARILTDRRRATKALAGGCDEAMASFGRAEAAYRAAMEVGRSDETLPEGLCRVFVSVVTLNLYGSKPQPVEPDLREGDRGLRPRSAHRSRQRPGAERQGLALRAHGGGPGAGRTRTRARCWTGASRSDAGSWRCTPTTRSAYQ